MMTPEILRRLRGMGATATTNTTDPQQADQQPSAPQPPIPPQPSAMVPNGAPVQASVAPRQVPAGVEAPVKLPLKRYDDEDGHVAIIDDRTNKPVHFNERSGRPYAQEDINFFSLRYATRDMSPREKNLLPEQVITQDTLYDKFGSPVFTAEEIKRAAEALNASESSSGGDADNTPHVDAFGYPI